MIRMRGLASRIILLFVFVPAVVFGVGLWFHTSYDATILGKYSGRYFSLLCIWFLIVLPLFYLLGRFLGDTHSIVLSRGRTIPVRPRLKVTVLVIGLVIGVLGVDTYLRHLMANRAPTFLADMYHPYLQNVPNSAMNKLAINAAGFRGKDIPPTRQNPPSYRVFLFGGSTMFSGTLRVPDSPGGILEHLLKERYPGIDFQIQNAATDWHSSQHSVMKLLFQALDYDPDVVVIYHGVNDLVRGLTPTELSRGEYWNDYRHYLGAVVGLLDHNRTRRTVMRLYTGCWFSDFRYDAVPVLGPDGRGVNGMRVIFLPRTEPVEVTEWKSLGAFERNMRYFAEIAQARGIPVVMASQPSIYRPDLTERELAPTWIAAAHHEDGRRPSLASMIDGMAQFNATTRRVAEDMGAGFVDLDAAMPKTLEYFYDDVHYTRRGAEVVAQTLYEHLVGEGLVDAWAAEHGLPTE
jgi:hypothetical protein